MLVVLDTEIDTDRAAAGDPISAKIAKPVIDPATKRVLEPAGTAIRGRITHLEHHVEGEKYFVVSPSFDIVFDMILDAVHQVRDNRLFAGSPIRSGGSRVETMESHSGFRGGGTFIFPTSQPRYVVPSGYNGPTRITIGGN